MHRQLDDFDIALLSMEADMPANVVTKDDARYYFTCSIPYVSTGTTLPIKKEPWLHVKLISVTKAPLVDGRPDNMNTTVKWYAMTYVWDTRQVVQFVELKPNESAGSAKYHKALDNGKALNDKANQVPGWAKRFLARTAPVDPANL